MVYIQEKLGKRKIYTNRTKVRGRSDVPASDPE